MQASMHRNIDSYEAAPRPRGHLISFLLCHVRKSPPDDNLPTCRQEWDRNVDMQDAVFLMNDGLVTSINYAGVVNWQLQTPVTFMQPAPVRIERHTDALLAGEEATPLLDMPMAPTLAAIHLRAAPSHTDEEHILALGMHSGAIVTQVSRLSACCVLCLLPLLPPSCIAVAGPAHKHCLLPAARRDIGCARAQPRGDGGAAAASRIAISPGSGASPADTLAACAGRRAACWVFLAGRAHRYLLCSYVCIGVCVCVCVCVCVHSRAYARQQTHTCAPLRIM